MCVKICIKSDLKIEIKIHMCQMCVKCYLVIFPNICNVSNVCQILLSKFSPTFVSNVCQILLSNFPQYF